MSDINMSYEEIGDDVRKAYDDEARMEAEAFIAGIDERDMSPQDIVGTAKDYLPACQNEDDTNCYWDAKTMGNGIGTSFVSIGEHGKGVRTYYENGKVEDWK